MSNQNAEKSPVNNNNNNKNRSISTLEYSEKQKYAEMVKRKAISMGTFKITLTKCIVHT